MALEAALASLRAGRLVILRDDRDSNRAAVVVAPAESGAGGPIRWPHGAGEVTLALDRTWLDRLGKTPPVAGAGPLWIGLEGVADAAVAKAVLDPAVPDAAFSAGGPLRLAPIAPGGALATRSLEAGAHDLLRLATGSRAALLAKVSPGAEPALLAGATLTEIAAYRERTEVLVEVAARARLPSMAASEGFTAHAFVSLFDGVEHLALVKGDPAPGALVRVHSECLTGDALGSLRCDCGEQLRAAMSRIAAAPSGALIYLRGHEGRGIGLANKIRAYELQDRGLDTAQANAALGFPHDSREYAVAAQILKRLGFGEVRLMSNNPRKARGLRSFGVSVREELPLVLPANPFNLAYLNTKRDTLGHRFPVFDDALAARVGGV